MKVVGVDQDDWPAGHVHTIDIWYSSRRRRWIVERLDGEGHLIGAAHTCRSAADAEACVADWRRTHDEMHLLAVRVRRPRVRAGERE